MNYMSEQSLFESRTGLLRCNSALAFNFLGDLRNLVRFIPSGSVSDLNVEKDECSFRVDLAGKVSIHISEKVPYSEIVYSGTVPQTTDFSMSVGLSDNEDGKAETRIVIKAGINPFFRMLINDPVRKALETIISEMEKFNDWQASE
jgi:hypothetical protein